VRRPSLVTRAFDQWVARLDQSIAEELTSVRLTSVRSWILTSLFVLALVAAGAFIPSLKSHFALRARPALLTFAPALLSAVAFSAWHANRKEFGRAAWLAVLIGSAYVQFFCASLVAWSDAHAAGWISSLFLITAVYHGHAFRVTLHSPFLAIGTMLAAIGAAALNPTADRITVLAVMGVAAVTVQLIVGRVAVGWDQTRKRSEQLSAAVRAQVLNDQQVELNRLSETLSDVLGRNHDLNNSVMAMQLNADQLQMELDQQANREVVSSVLQDLVTALSRVQALVSDVSGSARGIALLEREEVPFRDVLAEACKSVQARFPNVRCHLQIDPQATFRVSLHGGAITLRRIVENLLINACEGDGECGASSAEVRVGKDDSGGRVRISVSDDGPGFPAAQIAQGIQAFVTGKRQGTGLGLYTSERLLRANGGSLTRVNRPDGGAIVTVFLPLRAD
jgi:two-component system, NtrC family, C4-dicarboxylate transport sensor histidine kinase DctB